MQWMGNFENFVGVLLFSHVVCVNRLKFCMHLEGYPLWCGSFWSSVWYASAVVRSPCQIPTELDQHAWLMVHFISELTNWFGGILHSCLYWRFLSSTQPDFIGMSLGSSFHGCFSHSKSQYFWVLSGSRLFVLSLHWVPQPVFSHAAILQSVWLQLWKHQEALYVSVLPLLFIGRIFNCSSMKCDAMLGEILVLV